MLFRSGSYVILFVLHVVRNPYACYRFIFIENRIVYILVLEIVFDAPEHLSGETLDPPEITLDFPSTAGTGIERG